MTKILISFSCLFILSCKTATLLIPVKHSVFPSKNTSVLDTKGEYIFLIPTISFDVVSAENCSVLHVIKQKDLYIIVTKGRYQISYSELINCSVQPSQNLKKGQKIGEVKHMSSAEEYLSNYITLTMTIQDSNNHYITDLNLFKRSD